MMQTVRSDSILILGCVLGIFLIGVLCLFWPRGMQGVSVWWADRGMYPFPGFVKSPAYRWILRFLGLICIAVTLFLLTGVLKAVLAKLFP